MFKSPGSSTRRSAIDFERLCVFVRLSVSRSVSLEILFSVRVSRYLESHSFHVAIGLYSLCCNGLIVRLDSRKNTPGEIVIQSDNGIRVLRSTPDWSEGAINGDHLWTPTSASGDLCYVESQDCSVRAVAASSDGPEFTLPFSYLAEDGPAIKVLRVPDRGAHLVHPAPLVLVPAHVLGRRPAPVPREHRH